MKRWIVGIFSVYLLLSLTFPVYAVNDVVIDGLFDDWSDENLVNDPLGDSTPDRTDYTQTAIARDIGDSGDLTDDVIYLLCKTDTSSGGGFKCVFYLDTDGNFDDSSQTQRDATAEHLVVAEMNSSCQLQWVAVDGTLNPTGASGAAAFTQRVYSTDNDDDCGVEIAVPIALLASAQGNPVMSYPWTRPAGGGEGGGSDKDDGLVSGIGPASVTLVSFSVDNRASRAVILSTVTMILSLTIAMSVWSLQRRARP